MYVEFGEFRTSILTQSQNVLLWILLAMIVFDFLTGTLKAMKLKELNSSVAREGMLRHGMVFLLNAVVNIFAHLLGYGNWANIFTGAFLFVYLESLMENWGQAGLPLPDEIKSILDKLPRKMNKEYYIEADVMKIEEKEKEEKEDE